MDSGDAGGTDFLLTARRDLDIARGQISWVASARPNSGRIEATQLPARTPLLTCAGFGLLWRDRQAGYWILLSYVIAQIVFYPRTEIPGSLTGGGLPFRLFHARDPIVWLAFLAGDLNFPAAIGAPIYLVRDRRMQTKS